MPKAVKNKSAPKARKVRLPTPEGVVPAKKRKLPKPVRVVDERVLTPLAAEAAQGSAAILETLWTVVEARRTAGDTAQSHSARLIARGTAKVAQKLGEEAVECVIEATLGNRKETVLESADLLYHLVVLWVNAGIRPEEVWAELTRRQGVSGIVEKSSRPRAILRAGGTTKLA